MKNNLSRYFISRTLKNFKEFLKLSIKEHLKRSVFEMAIDNQYKCDPLLFDLDLYQLDKAFEYLKVVSENTVFIGYQLAHYHFKVALIYGKYDKKIKIPIDQAFCRENHEDSIKTFENTFQNIFIEWPKQYSRKPIKFFLHYLNKFNATEVGFVMDFISGIKPRASKHFNYDITNRELHYLLHCHISCLLYTSPSPRDGLLSRMPSSA